VRFYTFLLAALIGLGGLQLAEAKTKTKHQKVHHANVHKKIKTKKYKHPKVKH